MADNQTNRLSELLRNYNGEGPATSNLNMLAQGLRSRNKEPMNKLKPVTMQDFLDKAALATSPVPVVGDVVGIGADAYRFSNDPSSRTPLNFGLAALGLLPLIPAAGAAAGLFRGSAGPALGGNQLGMINIAGRGRVPETGDDVKKLADRFDSILNNSGVDYASDKSGISPARYFSFESPKTGDQYKVRISDHKNVHGANFSVDPNSMNTFEEMLDAVRGEGVNLKLKSPNKPKFYPVTDEAIEKHFGKKISDIGEKTANFFRRQYVLDVDGNILQK